MGQAERVTQERVIRLFQDELHYRLLGDFSDRKSNSNVEEGLLNNYLKRCGYTQPQINSALYKLRVEADNHNRSLYQNNQAVYELLRFGIPVKVDAGKVTETVKLVDWEHPEENDFAIAEVGGNFGQEK